MTGQPAREAHIKGTQRQRTVGGAEFDVLDQGELQAEADNRRAEQNAAVDVIALARRPTQQGATAVILRGTAQFLQFAPSEQQANGEVHQEEQGQEGFGAPEQVRCIGAQTPGQADAERADEADQVQQAPGLEPGDGENAGIEQGEITEQGNMAASASGGQ